RTNRSASWINTSKGVTHVIGPRASSSPTLRPRSNQSPSRPCYGPLEASNQDEDASMTEAQRLAAIGRLLGEPSRAAMLMTLMDGRAFTAAELARAAGVTPQTASAHLAQL